MQGARSLAWDDLRLVKAIAEARNLPAAAAWIGVNHSTAFRRLKQIEGTLGLALFEKHRSGYTLTAAGEEIAALAARVDEDVAAVTRKLAGQDVAPSGELRVATNDSLLVDLLTPLFAAFRQRYPGVRLDILIGNQALNLAKRDADVAIRATDNPPENLVGRRAARIAWALYGRAADFPDGVPVDKAMLKEKNWVSIGEQLGALNVVKWVTANIAAERVVYKVNTVLGLAEGVEAGAGIGYLPCFIADARPSLIRLEAQVHEFGSDLWLLTHPDLRHSARVRVFLDFLAAQLAKRRSFIDGSGGSADRESDADS
jgi:DNA-binding transcriptional LysR family regulator